MGSERVEEYLEAIFKRQEGETPVSPSALAEDLKVSLPAVTDMMRRLQDSGLIDYKPNKGALLTGKGRRAAASIVRRHRLWERFLMDILGLKWDRVHDEACRLEHATSPETEARLASLIGDAVTCPHGHPIPDKDGNIENQGVKLLSELEPQQKVRISAVVGETAELLSKVEKWGLKPETIVWIESRDTDGSMKLKVGDRTVVLGKDMTGYLLARPLSSQEEVACEEEVVPLSALRTGEWGVVKSYVGGRGMLGRCLSMGFTPGCPLRMIENYGSGPLLVSIRDTEIALGRQIAGKIMVARRSQIDAE